MIHSWSDRYIDVGSRGVTKQEQGLFANMDQMKSHTNHPRRMTTEYSLVRRPLTGQRLHFVRVSHLQLVQQVPMPCSRPELASQRPPSHPFLWGFNRPHGIKLLSRYTAVPAMSCEYPSHKGRRSPLV